MIKKPILNWVLVFLSIDTLPFTKCIESVRKKLCCYLECSGKEKQSKIPDNQ